MNIYWGAGAALIFYEIIAFITGKYLLGLEGEQFAMFFMLLSALGISATAFFCWFQAKVAAKRAAAAEGGGATPAAEAGGNTEVDLLVRDAEARLAAAKVSNGASMGNLPVIFLIGDQGTTKTSIIVNSGLEPELLAGHVYQDNSIIPTRAANFWFSRRAVFAEAGGKLLTEPGSWARLIKRLRPGQFKSVVGSGGTAPRAAVLCFNAENFLKPGATDAIAAASRAMHARLNEISQQLGISFPVYVLFTKADRLPNFADFVRNLSNEEATQVFGTTLPLRAQTGGVYAEEEARRLTAAFNDLIYSLSDKRIVFLPRENDQEKLPTAYEFPREFRKLRSAVVQFLVDVCRPSQLMASPFLRGFYFTGVRPVVINEMAASPAAAPRQAPKQAFEDAASATRMFNAAELGQAAAAQMTPAYSQQPVGGTRKVPQWLFLSHLFNDVILQDRAAMGSSEASVKTNTARRAMFGTVAALSLLFLTFATVSYLKNRSMLNSAAEAARAIPASDAQGQTLASMDSLRRLEDLRQSLEQIMTYEEQGHPFSMGAFLYSGTSAYPHVYRLYFDKFRQLLFGQTQRSMMVQLQGLPSEIRPQDEFGQVYNTVKAYLVTTREHGRNAQDWQDDWLSSYLHGRWSGLHQEIGQDRLDLARKQFDFYSKHLRKQNPFDRQANEAAVDRGQFYLSKFSGIERNYRALLMEAAKGLGKIRFYEKFPDARGTVVNTKEVDGAFTKDGWNNMQKALKGRSITGEKWVLGDKYPFPMLDRAQLEKDVNDLYVKDYIAQWRMFLRDTSVARYQSTKDAADKLQKMAMGNQSPLLAALWLASVHTNVDPRISAAFRPVQGLIPPSDQQIFIAKPEAQQYAQTLGNLQSVIQAQAEAPSQENAKRTQDEANRARQVAMMTGGSLPPDDGQVVTKEVGRILLEPITAVPTPDLTGKGPLNAAGAKLCGDFKGVTAKFPFQPDAKMEASMQEVDYLLKPKTGALWQFYETTPLKDALVFDGSKYVESDKSPFKINPAFLRFMNNAATFSRAVYGPDGAAGAKLAYGLEWLGSDQIESMTLSLDSNQPATFSGTSRSPKKQFVWTGTAGSATGSYKLGGTAVGIGQWTGPWAMFHFIADAETYTPAGGGYDLQWVVRSGREGKAQIVNGRELTYRFHIDTPIPTKGFLAGIRCAAPVAQ